MQTIPTPLPQAQRVRGTLDLLPEDAARLRNLEKSRLREFFELYAYQGIDTPVLETLDLFLRKSGDEIAARMYTFTHWNRKLCLRPEFTASVMRAYVNGMQERALPLRLHYAGPTFHYEKPQRGRYRQFTQVGVECIGASGAVADAEILQLACGALETVGVPRYRLVVGHLGVVLQLLAQLGLSPHAQMLVLNTLEHLARRGADPAAASQRIVSLLGSHSERSNGSIDQADVETPLLPDLVNRFGPSGATRVAADLLALGGLPLEGGSRSAEDIVQRLLEKAARTDPARAIRSAIDFIGCLHNLAGPLDTALPELLGLLREYHLDTRPLDEVRAALDLFACYGSRPGEVTIDLSLGRGLRYYTGMVFEIYHDGADGALQLCGGGRYDDLVRALGARSAIPACGFSFGLERVDLCLADSDTEVPVAADVLLAVMDESAAPDAVRAAEAARATGVRVELDLRPSAARSALRRAVRGRIPLVAMLGSRERDEGQILLRRLNDRTEQHVSLDGFVAAVRQAM